MIDLDERVVINRYVLRGSGSNFAMAFRVYGCNSWGCWSHVNDPGWVQLRTSRVIHDDRLMHDREVYACGPYQYFMLVVNSVYTSAVTGIASDTGNQLDLNEWELWGHTPTRILRNPFITARFAEEYGNLCFPYDSALSMPSVHTSDGGELGNISSGYRSTGVYGGGGHYESGAVTNGLRGDWLQIRVRYPTILTDYRMIPNFEELDSSPRGFTVFGSIEVSCTCFTRFSFTYDLGETAYPHQSHVRDAKYFVTGHLAGDLLA